MFLIFLDDNHKKRRSRSNSRRNKDYYGDRNDRNIRKYNPRDRIKDRYKRSTRDMNINSLNNNNMGSGYRGSDRDRRSHRDYPRPSRYHKSRNYDRNRDRDRDRDRDYREDKKKRSMLRKRIKNDGSNDDDLEPQKKRRKIVTNNDQNNGNSNDKIHITIQNGQSNTPDNIKNLKSFVNVIYYLYVVSLNIIIMCIFIDDDRKKHSKSKSKSKKSDKRHDDSGDESSESTTYSESYTSQSYSDSRSSQSYSETHSDDDGYNRRRGHRTRHGNHGRRGNHGSKGNKHGKHRNSKLQWLKKESDTWFNVMEKVTNFEHRKDYKKKFLERFRDSVKSQLPGYFESNKNTPSQVKILQDLFEKQYFDEFGNIRQIRQFFNENMQVNTTNNGNKPPPNNVNSNKPNEITHKIHVNPTNPTIPNNTNPTMVNPTNNPHAAINARQIRLTAPTLFQDRLQPNNPIGNTGLQNVQHIIKLMNTQQLHGHQQQQLQQLQQLARMQQQQQQPEPSYEHNRPAQSFSKQARTNTNTNNNGNVFGASINRMMTVQNGVNNPTGNVFGAAYQNLIKQRFLNTPNVPMVNNNNNMNAINNVTTQNNNNNTSNSNNNNNNNNAGLPRLENGGSNDDNDSDSSDASSELDPPSSPSGSLSAINVTKDIMPYDFSNNNDDDYPIDLFLSKQNMIPKINSNNNDNKTNINNENNNSVNNINTTTTHNQNIKINNTIIETKPIPPVKEETINIKQEVLKENIMDNDETRNKSLPPPLESTTIISNDVPSPPKDPRQRKPKYDDNESYNSSMHQLSDASSVVTEDDINLDDGNHNGGSMSPDVLNPRNNNKIIGNDDDKKTMSQKDNIKPNMNDDIIALAASFFNDSNTNDVTVPVSTKNPATNPTPTIKPRRRAVRRRPTKSRNTASQSNTNVCPLILSCFTCLNITYIKNIQENKKMNIIKKNQKITNNNENNININSNNNDSDGNKSHSVSIEIPGGNTKRKKNKRKFNIHTPFIPVQKIPKSKKDNKKIINDLFGENDEDDDLKKLRITKSKSKSISKSISPTKVDKVKLDSKIKLTKDIPRSIRERKNERDRRERDRIERIERIRDRKERYPRRHEQEAIIPIRDGIRRGRKPSDHAKRLPPSAHASRFDNHYNPGPPGPHGHPSHYRQPPNAPPHGPPNAPYHAPPRNGPPRNGPPPGPPQNNYIPPNNNPPYYGNYYNNPNNNGQMPPPQHMRNNNNYYNPYGPPPHFNNSNNPNNNNNSKNNSFPEPSITPQPTKNEKKKKRKKITAKDKLIGNDPFFPAKWKQFTEIEKSDHIENMLHSHKKLLLFLDIDHTILHSTRDKKAGEFSKHSAFKEDTYAINFPNPYNAIYYCKFRPGFRELINTVCDKFSIILYTMGSRPYAEQVGKIIDDNYIPNKNYKIGNRIICREDHGDVPEIGKTDNYKKSINEFAPLNNEWCMIIDDTPEIWLNSDQVYRVPKYLFWPNPENFYPGTSTKSQQFSKNSPSTWNVDSLKKTG